MTNEPLAGETEYATVYGSIIDAVRIINKCRQEVEIEEDIGFVISPVCRILNNAANHILKEANLVLRSGKA